MTVCWVIGEEGGELEEEDCWGLEGVELDPEEGEELEPDWRCACSMFCTFCSFFSWLASCCWRSLFTCTNVTLRLDVPLQYIMAAGHCACPASFACSSSHWPPAAGTDL